MRLFGLTVNNLGVFRGRHSFDFAPVRKPDSGARHLVVISGHNGVGKSTLFQSLDLALHGALSIGERAGRTDYSKHLLGRLHRYAGTGVQVTSLDGSVELEFEFVQSGRLLRVEVKREWQRNGARVNETLSVLCNGEPPSVDAADYQAWLNELVPTGLAPLCFFDAERLDTLASAEAQGGLMGESLRRLLGLDLVERLHSDLERYTVVQGGGRKVVGRLREEALNHQAAIEEREARLGELRAQAETLSSGASEIEAALTRQENRLVAEGGSYAARRPALQERLAKIEGEVKKVAAQVEILSSELLPFCLVPELCQQLGRRLIEEAKMQLRRTTEGLWHERVGNFRAALQRDEVWAGVKLSGKIRNVLIERLIQELQATGEPEAGEEFSFIHNLPEAEEGRLHDWISQTFQVIPQAITTLCDSLRDLQSEQRQTEAELRKAPEDDVLAPIHAEILRLQESLKLVQKQQATLSEQIGAIGYQRDEQAQMLQRVDEQLRKAQLNEQRLALAENSKLALQAYKDALTRQRIAALEEKFVACFNTICRKEQLLSSIRINPDDFAVELHGVDGEVLSIADLSAGERQLYALALLWALRRVSGRQLPLAIDTPLARLDDIHRARLIHDYIPAVSDQVLLFATNAELDADLLKQVEPYLARLYQLNFDQTSGETIVGCTTHPSPKDVVLYRSGSAEETGDEAMSGSNGAGQLWLHDPAHVDANGHGVKRSVLPATAKRLVLIDPEADSYNWLHVAELERVVKDKYILSQLRNGHQIFDVWQDDWTDILKQAGYDSIATGTIEGTAEYVLDASKLLPLNGKEI